MAASLLADVLPAETTSSGSTAQEEEDKAKIQKELSILTDRLQKVQRASVSTLQSPAFQLKLESAAFDGIVLVFLIGTFESKTCKLHFPIVPSISVNGLEPPKILEALDFQAKGWRLYVS